MGSYDLDKSWSSRRMSLCRHCHMLSSHGRTCPDKDLGNVSELQYRDIVIFHSGPHIS